MLQSELLLDVVLQERQPWWDMSALWLGYLDLAALRAVAKGETLVAAQVPKAPSTGQRIRKAGTTRARPTFRAPLSASVLNLTAPSRWPLHDLDGLGVLLRQDAHKLRAARARLHSTHDQLAVTSSELETLVRRLYNNVEARTVVVKPCVRGKHECAAPARFDVKYTSIEKDEGAFLQLSLVQERRRALLGQHGLQTCADFCTEALQRAQQTRKWLRTGWRGCDEHDAAEGVDFLLHIVLPQFAECEADRDAEVLSDVPCLPVHEPYLEAALQTLTTSFVTGQPSQMPRVLESMLRTPSHVALLLPCFDPVVEGSGERSQPQLFVSLYCEAAFALKGSSNELHILQALRDCLPRWLALASPPSVELRIQLLEATLRALRTVVDTTANDGAVTVQDPLLQTVCVLLGPCAKDFPALYGAPVLRLLLRNPDTCLSEPRLLYAAQELASALRSLAPPLLALTLREIRAPMEHLSYHSLYTDVHLDALRLGAHWMLGLLPPSHPHGDEDEDDGGTEAIWSAHAPWLTDSPAAKDCWLWDVRNEEAHTQAAVLLRGLVDFCLAHVAKCAVATGQRRRAAARHAVRALDLQRRCCKLASVVPADHARARALRIVQDELQRMPWWGLPLHDDYQARTGRVLGELLLHVQAAPRQVCGGVVRFYSWVLHAALQDDSSNQAEPPHVLAGLLALLLAMLRVSPLPLCPELVELVMQFVAPIAEMSAIAPMATSTTDRPRWTHRVWQQLNAATVHAAALPHLSKTGFPLDCVPLHSAAQSKHALYRQT